jgi:hypothetical protein
MNVPLLTNLVHLIEEIFKAEAPIAGKAAAAAALGTVEADPKIAAVTAASYALLEAAQTFKSAVSAPTISQGDAGASESKPA